MMEKIKVFLWKWGLYPNICPRCSGKLKDVDFFDGLAQRYECTKCGWGKDK